MLRFLISLLLLGAALFIVVFLGNEKGFFEAPSFTNGILIYSATATFAVFFILQKKSGALQFTQKYILSIVLKLLSGCVFILIVIFLDRENAFGNALLFIVSYLLFTALEVGFLYSKTVRNQA